MVFLKAFGLSLALVLLSGCTALTSLFFYPQTVWISTPADFKLDYQDIWLQAHDGTALHSWWIPAQGEVPDSNIMVLYLHGNAENISSHSRSVYWLARNGVSLLTLDYRGFGASEGRAMLPAVLQDVEAAAQWLRASFPNKRLVILGQSIGTALAVNFTAQAGERYQVDALVLDAPLASFGGVARFALTQGWLGWIIWPFTVLVPGQWDPIDQVTAIEVPVLLMHSPDDKVIPYKQGKAMYRKWQQQQSVAPVCWLESRGPHVGSFAFADLRTSTLAFIESLHCPVATPPDSNSD